MVSNKLLSLLQTFNKYELNRLRKFLQSPYFNENRQLLDLFEVLNKYLRSDTLTLDRYTIWHQLFLNKPYNDTRFRRLCSDLNKMTQEFLVIHSLKKHPLAIEAILLKIFNAKGLDKHFLSTERIITKITNKMPLRDTRFHYQSALIEYEKHLFLEKNDVMRTRKVNLETADFQLDCYYLTQKLKNYCDAINYKNILNIDININFIDELLRDIDQKGYLKVPSIAIYYQILLSLIDRDTEVHFHELKRLLKIHGTKFSKAETRTMYIFAQNFCIKKINTGHTEYYHALFEIYQALIQAAIIPNEGLLMPRDYRNITSVGLKVGAYDWVEKFVMGYNMHLPKQNRKTELAYNLALVNFYRTQYEKVIELLRDMSFKNAYNALQGRWLLLKTYYELDEFDALDALMDSFRIFLRRNKSISKHYQQSYLNAIKFLQKIMKLPYESKANRKKTQEKLKAIQPITERFWLAQKLKEVMK